MNVNRIVQGRAEAQAKTYSYAGKGGNYAFQLLGLRNLEPGRYRARVLWSEPSKNPDGMHLVSTSTVNTTEGNKKKAIRFLTPDVLAPGEGYKGVPEVLQHLDETGKFDRLKEMGETTKVLREAIVALSPWRRYWLPVFIWAREVPGATPDAYSTFSSHGTDAAPLKALDKVLEMNESIKLVDAFFDLCRQYPDLDSAETGRDVFITVGKNRYSIEIAPSPSRLDPTLAKYASENYPDLPGLARKFYFKAGGEIASILQAQWWAKQLEGAKVFFPDHVDTSLTALGDLGEAGAAKEEPTSAGVAAEENFSEDPLPFDASDDAPHSVRASVDGKPAEVKTVSAPPVKRPPPPRRS